MKVIKEEKIFTLTITENELQIIIDCMNSADPELTEEEENMLSQLEGIE